MWSATAKLHESVTCALPKTVLFAGCAKCSEFNALLLRVLFLFVFAVLNINRGTTSDVAKEH